MAAAAVTPEPMAPATLDTLKSILQAQKHPSLRLGSNIVSRNPDVEIAALTLKDIPLTANKFDTLANGQNWYRFSFTVLGVGPPGFSTVPYTSTQKKGEKPAAGLGLYEDAGDNKTKLFSFEKGKTNKDRGVRVEDVPREQEGDTSEEAVGVTAVLAPGMHLAHFMRVDDFDKSSKFFVDSAEALAEREVLPAFSVVYFQVSSANVEQAKNGRLLKVKRMKLAQNAADVLAACVPRLPRTEQEFQATNACSQTTNWAMRENMDKSKTRVFALQPSATAFVSPDPEKEESVLVQKDATGNLMPDVLVTETALASLLPHADRTDRLKLLNIAIACEAVHMLVRTNVSDGVSLDCSGEAYTHRVVAITLDVNALLSLDLAEEAMQRFPDGPTNIWRCEEPFTAFGFLRMQNDDVCWGHDERIIENNNRKYEIAFRITADALAAEALAAETHPEAAGAGDARFLDKGHPGQYVPLEVMLVDKKDHGDFTAGRTMLKLELRPGQRQTGCKRKRMQLFD
jgi:hypothetical protein